MLSLWKHPFALYVAILRALHLQLKSRLSVSVAVIEACPFFIGMIFDY